MKGKNFKQSQDRENYMWQTYGDTIKNVLTNSNPNATIEKVEGMLDYFCGIDAVVNNKIKDLNQIRFISLRILNNNYNNFTFRVPTNGSRMELLKLLHQYNPTPYYHVQITEGSKGTQIAILNIEKLIEHVNDDNTFWAVIQQYLKKGDRNNYYSIPIAKFKRFIKIIELEN